VPDIGFIFNNEVKPTMFHKDRLPDPQAYYESQGLALRPGGTSWRTTRCDFHGGSDSLRLHLPSGAFVCMAGCGARGGDVLAYHMATQGLGFVEAARALGAWEDAPADANHRSTRKHLRPAQPSAKALLDIVEQELTICWFVLADALKGQLQAADHPRFRSAASRVIHAARVAHHAR
jgi:hypothetical protein